MTSYRIELSKSVQKFLRTHRDIAPVFFECAHQLSQDPLRKDLDIKRMMGTPRNHYRLRIFKYRFIYEILAETITVYFFEAGNRGDVYR